MTWDGTYKNSYQGKNSLEDDIREYAETGRLTYPTSTGGTLRIDDVNERIDVYGPSSTDPKCHTHDWYDGKTNTSGDHEGNHNN